MEILSLALHEADGEVLGTEVAIALIVLIGLLLCAFLDAVLVGEPWLTIDPVREVSAATGLAESRRLALVKQIFGVLDRRHLLRAVQVCGLAEEGVILFHVLVEQEVAFFLVYWSLDWTLIRVENPVRLRGDHGPRRLELFHELLVVQLESCLVFDGPRGVASCEDSDDARQPRQVLELGAVVALADAQLAELIGTARVNVALA